MGFPFRSMLLFSLTLIAVALVIFITAPTVTGNIVLDFPCHVSFDVTAPNSITAPAGEVTSFNVTVENVKCGLSFVSLTLDPLPADWYGVAPNRVASIAPVLPFTYHVDLLIPENAEPKTYVASFIINSDQGRFSKDGSIDITVIPPLEKPRTEVSIEDSKLNLTLEAPIGAPETALTLFVSFALVLGAITGILYYFFR